ncbi:hypothetical protein ACPDJR_07645 [Helicobacter pylori]|uniref:hypothetical protein n=1 Tax=Helicobacter pylori TaxID=210 RepID=UPI00308B95A9|nr:hypothetical protein KVM58_03670 [Helicobacter pylori]
MKQKVHSVSYLAKAEFEFKKGVYNLVALPAGAEVVKVSLEGVGNTEGDISMGFKDEMTEDFSALESIRFSNGTVYTNTRDYTATSNKMVVAKVLSDGNTDAKCVLRVLYFLPSVIEVEY